MQWNHFSVNVLSTRSFPLDCFPTLFRVRMCVRANVCSRVCDAEQSMPTMHKQYTTISKNTRKGSTPFQKMCTMRVCSCVCVCVYAILCDAMLSLCAVCYVLVRSGSICLYVCGAMSSCIIEEKKTLWMYVGRDRQQYREKKNRTGKSQRRIFNFCCFYFAARFLLWLWVLFSLSWWHCCCIGAFAVAFVTADSGDMYMKKWKENNTLLSYYLGRE